MKKQLLKSLIAVLIFNSAILISVNAQIVYTDIIPDVTQTCTGFCTKNYNLDLNNDNTIDYTITSYHKPPGTPIPTISYVKILPQGNNQFASTTLNTVKKLSLFDNIGTTLLWHGVTQQYFNGGPGNQGEWNNEVNKYVGLKLIVGGQIYYGWARLDVNVTPASATFTIKDYAYNSIPNQPIFAGQILAGQTSPTISVTGDSSICNGDSTTILVSQGTSFLWSTGETTSNITVSPSTTTTYSVVVYDSLFNYTVTLSQQIIVKPNLNTFIIQNNDSLIAIVIGGLSTSTFQWIDCATNLQIAGANSNIFIPTSTGSYAVIVNKDGCTDTSNCITVTVAGITENISSNHFSIYSFNKKLNIELNGVTPLNGIITVCNTLGQELKKIKIENRTMKIDMSDCKSGIYFVAVQTNDAIETKKFYLN